MLKEANRMQRKIQDEKKRKQKQEKKLAREQDVNVKKERCDNIKKMKMDAKQLTVPPTVQGSSIGKCYLCACSCSKHDSIKCVLCFQLYHVICVAHSPEELVLICPICKLM